MQTVVRCYFKTFGDFVTIYSTNLSKGGIAIASAEPVGVGARIRLEFKLRNDYPLITGVGEITAVQPGGFTARFITLDDESEKFLNEVVKVKAAEVKIDPGAPLPTYESKVEHIDGDAVDEFEEIEEAEALEEVEEVTAGSETVEDAFAGIDEPAGAEADFSGLQLNAEAPAAFDAADPFGDLNAAPAAADDPFGNPFSDLDGPAEPADGAFGTDETVASGADGYAPAAAEEPAAFGATAGAATDTGGYESASFEDVPADESDEYEGMEQTPANPQALFDDIGGDGHAPAPFTMPEGEMAAIGETTASFQSKSRRALFLGAGVGVSVLALAGAGWFFYLRAPSSDAVQQPVMEPAAAAMTAHEPVTTAAAAVTGAVTGPASTAAAESAAPGAASPAPAGAPAPSAAQPPPPQAAAAATAKPAAAVKPARPKGPARRVTGLGAYPDGALVIKGDGNFGKVKFFGMSEPNRIVVDVVGVTKGFKGGSIKGKGPIARIRPGEHANRLRLVFDLAQKAGRLPAYEVVTAGDRIVVRVKSAPKAKSAKTPKAPPKKK